MKKHLTHILCGLSLFMSTAMSVNAAYVLSVTEIYSGQENPDPTEDWFELTNYGDMSWVQATDGSLYYDDASADPATADLMSGITEIAPGETVVYVDGGTDGLAEWLTVWSNAAGVQVGSYNGAGLGGGGDTVNVFTGDSNFPADGISNEVLIATASYPSLDDMPPGLVDGASFDTVLDKFSLVGDAAGSFISAGTAPGGNPSIGSPGLVATIPEPGSISLLAMSIVALLARRKF